MTLTRDNSEATPVAVAAVEFSLIVHGHNRFEPLRAIALICAVAAWCHRTSSTPERLCVENRAGVLDVFANDVRALEGVAC
jgi:hypothetical protein